MYGLGSHEYRADKYPLHDKIQNLEEALRLSKEEIIKLNLEIERLKLIVRLHERS